MNIKEEWKYIKGYENLYSVSNYGRIWSHRNKRCLNPILTNKGYLRVHLSKNGKTETFSVHRLVAMAFIDNPEKKPTVNHINEIKTDNRVENLEWATMAEQNSHGTRIERARNNTDYKSRNIDYSVVASKHNYYEMSKKTNETSITVQYERRFYCKIRWNFSRCKTIRYKSRWYLPMSQR